MMSNGHKKVCKVLNYTENLLISVSTVTRCGSISAFTSLVGISRNYEFRKMMKNLRNNSRN